MKFTIDRQSFFNELTDVLRAVPAKAPMEILTGVKLSADAQGIHLIGSDSAISIESLLDKEDTDYSIQIESEGSVVLPARLFHDVIRRLPTDTVAIDMDPMTAETTITSGQAMFKLHGTQGSQYPHLPTFDEEERIELPTSLFKNMIKQTVFAASNQENRPILTGIHLEASSQGLTASATDSHRLSKRTIPVDFSEASELFEPMTIPKKTVIELSRIADDRQPLYLIPADQQVIFMTDNRTIYSRLLEGNYPPVDRLIPTQHETSMVVNGPAFLQAIDRASLIAHEGKNIIVQLEYDGQETVKLSVPGNEASYVAETIATDEVSGAPLRISFNPDYMKEALQSFGDIEVKVDFQSAVRPLLVTDARGSVDPNNELYQVLTPVRTHYN